MAAQSDLSPVRIHGGPGPDGPATFDFSTTANACGPCPMALQAVLATDRRHYPDPTYTALKAQLADFHGVEQARVVLAASASEFIFRLTGLTGPGPVAVPQHAFGDYATAARGWGRACVVHGEVAADLATLRWVTDPSSPLGQSVDPLPDLTSQALTVLDRACEPLRLHGHSGWQASGALDRVFQLWSPNKALGLTGVRAAYAIAPLGEVGAQWCRRLEAACPSWPLGAEGVALLQAWVQPPVQAWVAASRDTLRGWQARQHPALQALGWQVLPGVTNFNLVRPPWATAAQGVEGAVCAGTGRDGDEPGHHAALHRETHHAIHHALKAAGVAWRDTASFGLPGAWRVSVQPPAAQDAMLAVLKQWRGDGWPPAGALAETETGSTR